MATNGYVKKTLATQAKNGPVVQQLSLAQYTELSGEYLINYPAFVASLDGIVNSVLKTADVSMPEGTPMELILPNLQGHATEWAQALDAQWQQGKIRYSDTGQKVKPWPGASQIAYAPNSNTMVLQWLKEGPEVAWIVVGVLVAILLYVYVSTLRSSPYTLSAYTPATGTGTTGTTPAPSGTTILAVLAKNWAWVALAVGGLAAAPFVVKSLAHTEEGANELKAAERGYLGGYGGSGY